MHSRYIATIFLWRPRLRRQLRGLSFGSARSGRSFTIEIFACSIVLYLAAIYREYIVSRNWQWQFCYTTTWHLCIRLVIPKFSWNTGPRLNIKIFSRYDGWHFNKDQTVVRTSYLYNGNLYTGMRISSYWNDHPHLGFVSPWVRLS